MVRYQHNHPNRRGHEEAQLREERGQRSRDEQNQEGPRKHPKKAECSASSSQPPKRHKQSLGITCVTSLTVSARAPSLHGKKFMLERISRVKDNWFYFLFDQINIYQITTINVCAKSRSNLSLSVTLTSHPDPAPCLNSTSPNMHSSQRNTSISNGSLAHMGLLPPNHRTGTFLSHTLSKNYPTVRRISKQREFMRYVTLPKTNISHITKMSVINNFFVKEGT